MAQCESNGPEEATLSTGLASQKCGLTRFGETYQPGFVRNSLAMSIVGKSLKMVSVGLFCHR